MRRFLHSLQALGEVADTGNRRQLVRRLPGHFAETGVLRAAAIVCTTEEGRADTGVDSRVAGRSRAERTHWQTETVGRKHLHGEVLSVVLTVNAGDEIHRGVERTCI